MTTKISQIYDAYHTIFSTLFPSKRELSDPFNIENNDELTLADSYGIYIGPGTNTERMVGCQYSIRRDIIVTLTKAMRATHKDVSVFHTTEKALLEELNLSIKDFCQNELVDGLAVKRDYISDNGINYVIGEFRNFIMVQATFSVEYFESLL